MFAMLCYVDHGIAKDACESVYHQDASPVLASTLAFSCPSSCFVVLIVFDFRHSLLGGGVHL